MSELLDFQGRENFSFLKFSSYAVEEEKKAFEKDCQRILEYAHATVRDMCLLGLRLREMKNSSFWVRVFDPESNVCFTYDRFDDFCNYAFGFSKTKVSNLLSIAEFVKLNGENVDFIDKKYAGYNTSQLVELASVDSYDRRIFSPEMSVSDMRLVKNLLKTQGSSTWTPESALAEAKRRFCKDTPKPKQENADILPGQISVRELAADKEVCEAEVEYMAASVGSSDVGTVGEEKKEEKYNLKSRDGRRYWMSHYREWDSEYNRGYYPLYERVYHYKLGNGALVYAAETQVCIDIEKQTAYESPRFYLKTELYDYPIQLSKLQLEVYMSGVSEVL